ncbi:MAG: hypothetical protein Q9Q13_08210 [Acidobacteriota bacterium]|nr:hypothetical protein [Acidobacteriota bacterium]
MAGALGSVMVVDARDPGQEKWREIIPERENAVIRSMALVGGRLFVNYLENVVTRLRSFDLEGRELEEIRFDELGTVSNLQGRWKDAEAFFSFQSFHIPSTIYRYDVSRGERSTWFRADLPVDPDQYRVEQLWFESKDGTRVPLFLVGRKGLEGDGPRPLLLNGYGGFDVSKLPRFSPCHHSVARRRRSLRGGEYSRRRRVRRAVASCRHAREQAEHLR